MFKTIKSIEHLQKLIDIAKNNKINYKIRNKNKNEIIKILAKSKAQNLFKKPNFLSFNTKIVFTKLK